MSSMRTICGLAITAAAAAMVPADTVDAQRYVGRGSYSNTQEVEGPPIVASPGTGSITALLDATQNFLTVNVTYANLLEPAGGAHIHRGGPTENGPIAIDFGDANGFLFGLRSGTYSNVFNLSLAQSFGTGYLGLFSGDVAAARADFVSNFIVGNAYGNIHSAARPAGEIRANLAVSAVPEPSTYALMAAGLGMVGMIGWRRRRAA